MRSSLSTGFLATACMGLCAVLQCATAQEQKGGATMTSKGAEAPAQSASEAGPEASDILKVCADPASLPQSNDHGEGYENKIAEALAHDLGKKKVEYTFFPQRMGFIRMTIRARDEQTLKYKCDLIIGVPKGYDMTATTRPYMHSTYALVFPDRPEFHAIKAPEDFLALPPAKLHSLRIGIFGQSPAADWLLKNGLIERAQMYAAQSGDPKENPGGIIDRDMSSGKIDAAVVWGPFAGLLVSKHTGPNGWIAVPFKPDPTIKFDYEMSMGVRFGEKAWKDTLDTWIGTHHDKIQDILAGYHIPLLDLS